MEIKTKQDGSKLTVMLSGRLDTVTAPDLEEKLKHSLDGVTVLVMDLKELEYISSAGLRVLLGAQKVMNRQGEMIVCGANATVMEIFEVTGFIDVLNIQE